MGVTPSSLRLLARDCKRFGLSGSVLTLGNQDVWATEEDVKQYLIEENYPLTNTYSVRNHTSHFFNEMSEYDNRFNAFIHARTLFEMLGFVEYADLDMFSQDQPYMLHDLNHTLPSELHNKFNLILDMGTTEHIFNVPNLLASVKNALQIGGCVVHSLPLPCLYWAQHGYYCFNPDLFIDYYSANGFEDINCMLLYYRRPIYSISEHNMYFKKALCIEYTSGMQIKYIIPQSAIATFWLSARKKHSVNADKMPYQCEYVRKDVEINSASNQDSPSTASRLKYHIMETMFYALQPLSNHLYYRKKALNVCKI